MNDTKTEMVAPTPEARTEMVAPPAKKSKKVRIRAMQAIAVSADLTLAPGQEADVDEAVAKEFCDRKFIGGYAFSGERGIHDAVRHTHVRAVRVTGKSDASAAA